MKWNSVFLDRFAWDTPSRIDNLFIGVLEIALGLWLLLPEASFALTFHSEEGGSTFAGVTENGFGMILILLGTIQCVLSIRYKWKGLKAFSIINVMFWVFITYGYIQALWYSTNVIWCASFTFLIVYEHFELTYFLSQKLPNNKKIGNI